MLPFTTKFFFSPSYAFALGGFCLLGSAFFLSLSAGPHGARVGSEEERNSIYSEP